MDDINPGVDLSILDKANEALYVVRIFWTWGCLN